MFGKIKTAIFVFALVGVTMFSRAHVFAQVKDTDSDGLTDQSEITQYNTDPLEFDTDGDGFSDGVEVLNKTDPLDPNNTPISTASNIGVNLIDKNDPIMWYVARTSGIAAFILLTIVVSFGLIQSSKSLMKYRFISAITALESHRMLAWTGIFAVIAHFGSLFFDQVIHLQLKEVLIPFQVFRDFKTTLGFDFNIPISLGIFGFYLILILVVTSEFRKKIVSTRVWRTIHYSSFVGYLLFLAHGFLTGSDSKELWMRAIYAGSLSLNLGLLLARIFRKKLFYPKLVKKPLVEPQILATNQIANEPTQTIAPAVGEIK